MKIIISSSINPTDKHLSSCVSPASETTSILEGTAQAWESTIFMDRFLFLCKLVMCRPFWNVIEELWGSLVSQSHVIVNASFFHSFLSLVLYCVVVPSQGKVLLYL